MTGDPVQDERAIRIFEIFEETIRWLNENGYWQCNNFVMMPNHIHLIIKLTSSKSLKEAMASFCRYTSRRIKPIIGLNDVLWEESFYDHGIRHDESFLQQLNYILQNPVRRGFVEDWRDWPFLITELLKR